MADEVTEADHAFGHEARGPYGRLRRFARSQWRELDLRADAARAVRRGEAVRDPAAASLAVAAARRVQRQRTWPPYVVVAALVLAVLAVLIGGFALVWYLATVVPTLASEPFRARRRRDRALAAEAANLGLVDEE